MIHSQVVSDFLKHQYTQSKLQPYCQKHGITKVNNIDRQLVLEGKDVHMELTP